MAERLSTNEFFLAAAGHFPASQAYAAADQAATYVQARAWDLVIVDTPPSGGGIDFFAAPAQMADLVGGRLLRWITGGPLPGRRFIYDRAARPVLRVADNVLGSDLLERVAEFLIDLRTTYDGVAQRGREIERVMREQNQALEKRIRSLSDQLSQLDRDMSDRLTRESQALREDLKQKSTDLKETIEKMFAELSSVKTDRTLLASLFVEVAKCLSQDLGPKSMGGGAEQLRGFSAGQ